MSYKNMNNWIENIGMDSSCNDPYLIRGSKYIRKNYRVHKKLIKVVLILCILSFVFVKFIEPLIEDNIIWNTFLMVLVLITFIGVFKPLSIKKNLSKNDISDIVDDKKEEDELNKEIEEQSTIG